MYIVSAFLRNAYTKSCYNGNQTVEPLLSAHPRGSALWPLNSGGR